MFALAFITELKFLVLVACLVSAAALAACVVAAAYATRMFGSPAFRVAHTFPTATAGAR